MKRQDIATLTAAMARSALVTVDVFDTLLLRTLQSERSRLMQGDRAFAARLRQSGFDIAPELLIETRLLCQRLAFRALDVRGGPGEVRLNDIIARQLSVLGLPLAFVDIRMEIEATVESGAVKPNRALTELLDVKRRAGVRVVAVTDTTLPGQMVERLIRDVYGGPIVDRVYSSADYGLTKRRGGLFPEVARREGVSLGMVTHMGDDPLADVAVPARLGVRAVHLRRPAVTRGLRRGHGLFCEGARRLAARRWSGTVAARRGPIKAADAFDYGHDVFGPILTQFCIQLWLYVNEAERGGETVLLFCARGGIGIREVFERVVDRLGLPMAAERRTLLISRVVAARAALLRRSPAAAEEFARELRNDTLATAAEALGGGGYDLDAAWGDRFDGQTFDRLLSLPKGRAVLADIKRNHALFEAHLDSLADRSKRLILCDTGLYGSTQRLLAEGMPGRSFESVHLARANYKGHAEDHFPFVAGLMVESNLYNPLHTPSSVLRYWQLIETLFEPTVPSVHTFSRNDDGPVVANSGPVDFGDVDRSKFCMLLQGALDYVEGLRPGDGAAALEAAAPAWSQLRRSITRPRPADFAAIAIGSRSIDFGRGGFTRASSASAERGLKRRIGAVWSDHWREGAIARQFPRLKIILLPALGAFHWLRFVAPSRTQGFRRRAQKHTARSEAADMGATASHIDGV